MPRAEGERKLKAQAVQESRWVGRVLREKWRIDGRIARGGMGTVFAATHRNNGSVAAIKILHPEFSRDKDTRSRFLQEGYAANQVNHPGVVRILDDDVTEEGLAYLVMELLEGELLEQRRIRKGGKLPVPEVYEFADQLLDVLAAAHGKGIVHRDIKPDNIFLTTTGRLKVLDFGFAQMKSGFRTEQTATGFLLGTPGFMAPEQAVGNRPQIDEQTDIWAVGATMFLLLTGQPVHGGESPAEMLVAAANYAVRPISTIDPGLPTKLASLVDRSLAFDKKDRWEGAHAMQAALRAVPGNPSTKEPLRRSIVDEGERFSRFNASLPPDDATLLDDFEEVEAGDVQQRSSGTSASPARPADNEKPTIAFGDDATMVAAPIPHPSSGREMRMPSGPPRPPSDRSMQARSPSDRAPRSRAPSDNAVVARSASGRSPPPRMLESLAPMNEPEQSDATLVMEARPRHPNSGSSPIRPAAGFLPRSSFPDQFATVPAQHRPTYPTGHDLKPLTAPTAFPRAYLPNEAPEQDQAPGQHHGMSEANSGSSKVLLYVVVAGVTMIVVILTGLLIIVGVD